MRDRPQARTAPLVRSPCRGDRFPRSMQEPAPSSRHLHAGRHLGSQQAPPRLIPGLQSIPGFDAIFVFRHVISGSLSLAFLAHTCRAQRRDFSVTLTTTTLYRSSSRWFAASACTTAAEGHRAERPAPPSHAQHRIQNLGLLHPASFNVRGTPLDDLRACRRVSNVGGPTTAWRSKAAVGARARTPSSALTLRASGCFRAEDRPSPTSLVLGVRGRSR